MRNKKTYSKKRSFTPIKLSKKGFILISLFLISLLCIELYYISRQTPHQEVVSVENTSKDIDKIPEKEVSNETNATAPKTDSKDTLNTKKEDKTLVSDSQSQDSTYTYTKPSSENDKKRVALNSANGNKDLEFPAIYETDYILHNNDGRYTICYSTKDRQPYWAAYTLTSKDVGYKNAKRKDNFRPDLEVINKGLNSANLSDYRGSSFDRGHLVPSADRDNSQVENNATFLLSNIAPQAKNLNRFVWSALENEVRKLAGEHDLVYITTGGVLNYDTLAPIKVIGDSVTVPKQFYKVLLIKDKENYYSIGYLMPNSEDCGRNYKQYAVTVDSIEKITGLDFFYSLDDSIEEKTESYIDKNFWY